MGYTHYWRGRAEASEQLIHELSVLVENSDIPVRFESEENRLAHIDTDYIRFNGVGEDGHETFLVQFGVETAFDFCKTAYKPYDALVVAALVLIEAANPDTFSWSSDGEDEDHAAGRELAFSAAGWL